METPTRKRPINPLALILILSAVFFILFLIVSAVMFMNRSPSTSSKSQAFFSSAGSGSIGVIEVDGVIMESKKTLEQLKDFEEDSSIKGIVLRINSPGGSVAPSQEIYEALKVYKKPVVSSMSSVAASGGYYIARGTKKIYANAGTLTGSIGVIMQFANLERLYEWAKIRRYAIKTGKFKDVGAEYKDMSADERGLIQALVDDVLTQFKKAVAEGRKLPMDKVTAVADGRILTGAQAKAAKLVDELGTLQDAIKDVAKQAGIKGKPSVVYPEKSKRKLLDLVMGLDDEDAESSSQNSMNLASILARLIGVNGATGGQGSAELLGLSPGIYWIWSGAR